MTSCLYSPLFSYELLSFVKIETEDGEVRRKMGRHSHRKVFLYLALHNEERNLGESSRSHSKLVLGLRSETTLRDLLERYD